MRQALFLSAALLTVSIAIPAAGDQLLPSPGGRSAIALQQPGHDHKDGDHKHDDKHDEHKGEQKDLGKQKIGGFEVQVIQVGDVKAGEEAVFIIKPVGTGEPKAVRAWVGVDSGQGSIRTKAEEEKEGEWHAHHQVSKPIPANSKLWIELETASGKQKAAFAFKS